MRLTRRNALIGLGTVAAGAGVIGGTGAFTSVNADREVSVSSTGDAGANVQIVVNEVQGLVDSGDGSNAVIGLSFENLNQNATTTYEGALTVTPQGSNGPYDVTIPFSPPNVTFTVNGGTDVGGGESVDINVTIDLTGSNSTSDIPSDATVEIDVSQSS
jgi:hypothetical protein